MISFVNFQKFRGRGEAALKRSPRPRNEVAKAFFRPARAGALIFAAFGLAASATAQLAPSAPASPVSPAPLAAAKKPLEVVLTQFKVEKDAQGKEQLVEAGSVKPGDVLEYKATYSNRSGKPITGLVADLPIPEGLEYLPKSAKPGAAAVKAATRNGVFAAEPLTRVVNGKSEPVPYTEYRTLRWTVGQLPANGVTVVSARARVEVAAPPPVQVSGSPQLAAPSPAKTR